jgi:hypothetical protein
MGRDGSYGNHGGGGGKNSQEREKLNDENEEFADDYKLKFKDSDILDFGGTGGNDDDPSLDGSMPIVTFDETDPDYQYFNSKDDIEFQPN